ncbi:MAG: RidA family protein [Spirochaetia bacterium]
MPKEKKVIHTDKAPAAIGPYSQAIGVGPFIFSSGQLGLNLQGEIVGDVKAQTKQALENLKAILEKDGSGLNQVIKTTVFLADMDDFSTVNEVYASYFSEPYPARSAYQVAKLPKGGLVEIEAIALASSCGCGGHK